MAVQTALDISAYERALMQIVRTLPAERIIQILDYARYVQEQAREEFALLEEDATEEEILADEARWDAQFAATQPGLKKMADKVRA
ncbi:MAG: hypothetical protein R3E79_26730 [Caldilineaceae bacterium]